MMSPFPRWAFPQELATRLIPSVVPRVKMIDSLEAAPKNSSGAGACVLVEFCCPRAQGVNSAVNVSMIFAVIPGDLVDHAGRMLRGGRVVQVDQRETIDLLIQDGKVSPVPLG